MESPGSKAFQVAEALGAFLWHRFLLGIHSDHYMGGCQNYGPVLVPIIIKGYWSLWVAKIQP